MPDPIRSSLVGETQRWLREAQGTRPEAFARLYERIAPAVAAWAGLRVARDRTPGVDPQDVVQETWLRAWRALETYDAETTPFRLWIFRVAKLVVLELQRDARRGGPGVGPVTRDAALRDRPDSGTAISRRVARDEAIRAFVDRVATLGDVERRLVVHLGLEGLSYEEVARRLDTTPAAAARRWQRLRARLGESGAPPDLLAED